MMTISTSHRYRNRAGKHSAAATCAAAILVSLARDQFFGMPPLNADDDARRFEKVRGIFADKRDTCLCRSRF